ncbi:hypothetical protein [Pseudomonas sp. UMAB-40]|uniref:hypothetical protein n=1 Tax=Pseudomonas sp. UMAB-40 TaxID=1365407 RepID=UPI001C577AA7|nr:hypothetical protein [Pseudomonas sp. UMAB-40]
MLSIATMVLCLALVFAYRSMAFHPVPVIAKRVRFGIASAIMVLSVTVGYLFPVEVGRGIQSLERHQSQQQSERTERRMAAEQRHAIRMIEIFGGADRYLAYLDGQNSKKNPF